MRFKKLREDVTTGAALLASRRLNNGNWDYWLVLELINMSEVALHKYVVTINAVSPEAAGGETVSRAIEDYCIEGEVDDIVKVEVLHENGVYAPLWKQSGDNHQVLVREAHKQAVAIEMLFGFFMDSPKNLMGHTGWDLIKGDLSWVTAIRNREDWERRASSK